MSDTLLDRLSRRAWNTAGPATLPACNSSAQQTTFLPDSNHLQGTGVDVFVVQPGMSQTDFFPKMVGRELGGSVDCTGQGTMVLAQGCQFSLRTVGLQHC